MNLQDYKITVILVILFGLFHTSCDQYVFYPPMDFDENGGFQYKKEQAICESNPEHTFYFGIDPGFSQCNGNLIYKYGY